MEENKAMSNMTEDLQLEVQSNIYAADWSSLERMAQLFKVEYAGKYKLLIVKHVTEPLEEEIGKKKEAKIALYLKDVKKILTKKPSPGIKNKDKSAKLVLADSKPPSTEKGDSVQKLLATIVL